MNRRRGCDRARLARCLTPASVAVVGGDEAARVIDECRKLNFAGALWPVNPKRDAMYGVKCYARVGDLPAAPDAAFVAVPADATIAAVAALADINTGGVVCYASGFSEVGDDGDDRQRRLTDAAGAMPVIGPNCYGFINATVGAALWPDYHGAAATDTGVAIFSQSGNVALNLTMQRRLLPLAWLVSLGNQATVGVEDCIAAALADERITAIGIHIEGLSDLRRFTELAADAREKNKPIIALKVGRSTIGARITMSHTATLAGEGKLYDALFARLGVGVVATAEEFIEALKLAAVTGALPGNRIASMSCSGGEATLVADLAAGHGLNFPPLDDAHRKKVQATLNKLVRVDNPLDYHTFIWGDEARMTDTFAAMMAGGKFDLTLLVLDIPGDDADATTVWMRAVRAFVAAVDANGCRGAVVALLSENLPADAGRLLLANGVAPLHGLAQALAAVAAVAYVGRAWAEALPPPSLTVEQLINVSATRRLDEAAAKQRLADAGLTTPPAVVTDNADAAVAAADDLGYPVAVKAVSPDLAHKREAGAVAVGVADADAVRGHAAAMLNISGRVLIEKMITGVVAELLLGVGHDRQFGHYLVLGFGGELVELIGDRVLLLPPVDEAMLRAALQKLKTAPLLHGYRGRPAADIAAVVECALRLCRLVADDDGIVEVEINPLMVKRDGKGVIIADALITLCDDD